MIISKIKKSQLKNLKPGDRIIRLISAEISQEDLLNLRQEVETSLREPNYSIITNYEIYWKEILINLDTNRHLIHANSNIARLEDLSEQVGNVFRDPDFPIVTPYVVHWREMKINKDAKRFLITAVYLEQSEVENLRHLVELTLMDPDVALITNYEVNWHESTTDIWANSKFNETNKTRLIVDKPKKISSKIEFIVKGLHAS